LKRIFIEGNPWLLGVTTVVSVLHSVFDMLAFKNDIGFWKSNKSMEGLSARTIVINALCQLIIFLYLLDNKTSYVVLFSSGARGVRAQTHAARWAAQTRATEPASSASQCSLLRCGHADRVLEGDQGNERDARDAARRLAAPAHAGSRQLRGQQDQAVR